MALQCRVKLLDGSEVQLDIEVSMARVFVCVSPCVCDRLDSCTNFLTSMETNEPC